jgi:hypothetical protein
LTSHSFALGVKEGALRPVFNVIVLFLDERK